MGQTILTADQRTVLELFAKTDTLRDFYLSGGTALAEFYLHHRDSDDLDFFSDGPVDLPTLESFMNKVKQHLEAQTARLERIHDRRLFFVPREYGELKIEFSVYPFPALEEKKYVNGIRVDSERDIAANKLAALVDRFEPKDFVDLYFLLQKHKLEDIRTDVETKFGISVTPLMLGAELAKVRRIEILPRMRRALSLGELRLFFAELAKTLKPDVIDS